MTTDNNSIPDTQTSTGTPVSTNTDSSTSNSTNVTSTDGTAENVAKNDPAKNRKLAEIEMMENLRKTYNLKLKIPYILKGLHTNQFFFMDLSDDFYETNYGKLISKIENTKLARYGGFKKGRFYVEHVTTTIGVDGTGGMELTLNPIASTYADYMKLQQDAEKTLIDSISNGGGTSSTGGGSFNSSANGECIATKEGRYGINNHSTRTVDNSAFEKLGTEILGNASANYATKLKGMTAEAAIKSIKHTYSYDTGNPLCPEKLFETYPNISTNCGNFAMLVKVICDVLGTSCAIYHGADHYFNFVKVDGIWKSVDLCTNDKSTTKRWTDGVVRNSAGWN